MPNVVHVYALANWLKGLPTATAMLAKCWSGQIGPTGKLGSAHVNTTCTSPGVLNTKPGLAVAPGQLLAMEMILYNYKLLCLQRGIAGYQYLAPNNAIP